jgi:ketosteroid isomerase-like protein
MNTHEQVIHRFYESFRARDADAMCACYHPQCVFSDPVFGTLSAAEAVGMWHMLCARAQDLVITFTGVAAHGTAGSAHWEARYAFSRTGRAVHNVIDASFTFLDDRIARHVDRFSLWKWAGMALGPAGTLLGWTPVIRGAVRKEARRGLEAFLRKGA